MRTTKRNSHLAKIALLVALSCVLQISESLIPHPVPGIRLGLANIITLIALLNLGFGYALEIAVLRTILSSLVLGTFMSPTFILSLAGAVVSTAVMGLLYQLTRRYLKYRLSIVGISIAGALSHNTVQLCLAHFILIRHVGIFMFFPWLCLGAVVMGWFTGMVAGNVCCKLQEGQQAEGGVSFVKNDKLTPVLGFYQPGNSLLHRVPVEIKIAAIFILALVILLYNNFWLDVGLFSFLGLIIGFSRITPRFLYIRTKRYSSILLAAFLFPLFFNNGHHVLARIANLVITVEGLDSGLVFAGRIIFLTLANTLLVSTTTQEEMIQGLSKILSPLRVLGISEKRIATILSLSLAAVPFLLFTAKKMLSSQELRRVKNWRRLTPWLSDFIATLYLEAERSGTFWLEKYLPADELLKSSEFRD